MAYLKKVGILANGCQRQGPKNDEKREKTRKNTKTQSKSKGKKRKNSYEILVDVVFRFAGYDMEYRRKMQGYKYVSGH